MWKDEIKKKEPNRFSASDYDYLSDMIPGNIANQMMQDITKLLEKYDDKLEEDSKKPFRGMEMTPEEYTFRALVAVIMAYEDRIGHSRNLMGAGRFFGE